MTRPFQGRRTGSIPVPRSRMALTRLRANLFFVIHALVVLFVYCSPILISWKLVLGLIGLFYLQRIFVGHCILTMIEFGTASPSTSFHYYYLTKLGVHISEQRLSFIIDYIMPPVILATALIWQETFGMSTLF